MLKAANTDWGNDAQRPSIDAVGILVFRPPGTDVD